MAVDFNSVNYNCNDCNTNGSVMEINTFMTEVPII